MDANDSDWLTAVVDEKVSYGRHVIGAALYCEKDLKSQEIWHQLWTNIRLQLPLHHEPLCTGVFNAIPIRHEVY